MSALSATVIEPNYKYFELLAEWNSSIVPGFNSKSIIEEFNMLKTSNSDNLNLHSSFVNFNDLEINEKRIKKSFIIYLCKKHRKLEGKNVEIKKMFEYLKRIKFKITGTEDKKRLFRQLIMSFALDSENMETVQLWKNYYSIIDDHFDLYTARDTK